MIVITLVFMSLRIGFFNTSSNAKYRVCDPHPWYAFCNVLIYGSSKMSLLVLVIAASFSVGVSSSVNSFEGERLKHRQNNINDWITSANKIMF